MYVFLSLSHTHTLPRMCIHDHLDHQQQGLNALPDLLSGQLSVDPSIISEVQATPPLVEHSCT